MLRIIKCFTRTIFASRLETLSAEVSSLKAVLEMRSEENRSLRCEVAKLQIRDEDRDKLEADLGKAKAHVEDLAAQVAKKTHIERRLSTENRMLASTVEKEVTEKKRLSMENEELHWRINQSLSSSMIEGTTLLT